MGAQDSSDTVEIKSYSKKELRNMYDCSAYTFATWIKPFLPELEMLGYKSSQRLFSPAQIKFIFEKIGTP